jgi:hypothetical protein
MMLRTPVVSSNLASVGYDDPTLTLEVGFRTGSVYQYYDVPRSVFDAVMAASSHGRALSRWVRGRYPYRQVG